MYIFLIIILLVFLLFGWVFFEQTLVSFFVLNVNHTILIWWLSTEASIDFEETA